MEKAYKSVIFFKAAHISTLKLKKTLSSSTLMKIFQTENLDEVAQIANMSSKAAIVIDEMNQLPPLLDEDKQIKQGLSRKFLLDWNDKVEKSGIDQLQIKGITVIKEREVPLVIEKIELYLFGKLNIFNKKEYIEPAEDLNNPLGKALFTHLKYSEVSGWKIIISTHEKEDDVSELIGKNWNFLLAEILKEARNLTKPRETKLVAKSYYQIVYPHFSGKEVNGLSIVHLVHDSKIEENLGRIKSFLGSI